MTDVPPEIASGILDLINRQKVEIEGLEETRYELACIIDELREERERLLQKLQQAKSEAIKEFAKFVIDKSEKGIIHNMDIPDYVKEMTEVQK